MDFNYYFNYFSKESIGRYDMSPIYSNIVVFNQLIDDIVNLHKDKQFNKVVAIDSIGFVLGTAVAIKMNLGIILVRKEGKIPLSKEQIISKSFIDYSNIEKVLEIDRTMIQRNNSYLIVDDWVETGSQSKAVIDMIETLGGKVLGIASIGSDRNEKTEFLFEKYCLKSIGVNV